MPARLLPPLCKLGLKSVWFISTSTHPASTSSPHPSRLCSRANSLRVDPARNASDHAATPSLVMATTFILNPLPLATARNPIVRTCRRRPAHASPSPLHRGPTMLAKFQPKESSSEQNELESQLEEILPPSLPSLTTLTGMTGASPGPLTEEKAEEEQLDLKLVPDGEEMPPELTTMGAALTSDQEESLSEFFKGVLNEIKYVEWPSIERVFRLTIIIFFTIVIACISLYLVDGFLYRVSRILFDGKI